MKQTTHPADLATRFKLEKLKEMSDERRKKLEEEEKRKKEELEVLEKERKKEEEEAEKLLEQAIAETKIDERLWRETDAKLVDKLHKTEEEDLEARTFRENIQNQQQTPNQGQANAQYESPSPARQQPGMPVYELASQRTVEKMEGLYSKSEWNREEKNFYEKVKSAAEGLKGRESELNEDVRDALGGVTGIMKRMGYKR